MSNGINQRQNEQNSILLLAAQRQLYNEAKAVKRLVFVFAVIVPLVLAIIKIFIKTNSILNTGSYISSIVSSFIGISFENHIKDKKENAAIIQQKFDTYVYQMPWNRRLFGVEHNSDIVVGEKSQKLFSNPEEKDKLYNWYPITIDELPLEEAILFCQKENTHWDAWLRKKYKNICIFFILAMICFMVGIGIIQNESTQQLIYRMAFITPLLYWLYETIKTLNSDIRRLNKLYSEITENVPKTMDDLQDIQKNIMDHRKSCRFIPNIVYAIFKNRNEETIQRSAEIKKRDSLKS